MNSRIFNFYLTNPIFAPCSIIVKGLLSPVIEIHGNENYFPKYRDKHSCNYLCYVDVTNF